MIELLVPDTVVVVSTREDLPDIELFAEEERSLGRAVEKCRRAFMTGRACARDDSPVIDSDDVHDVLDAELGEGQAYLLPARDSTPGPARQAARPKRGQRGPGSVERARGGMSERPATGESTSPACLRPPRAGAPPTRQPPPPPAPPQPPGRSRTPGTPR